MDDAGVVGDGERVGGLDAGVDDLVDLEGARAGAFAKRRAVDELGDDEVGGPVAPGVEDGQDVKPAGTGFTLPACRRLRPSRP